MRVKLSVLNRLSLLGLLGNKGDLTTIKIIRELREELSFTKEEHAAINFQPQPNGKLIWNEGAIPDKEIEFEGIREVIIEKVKTQLREMEKKGELLLDYLPLYETLIEGKE
ncbi:MAG: hypothetical protein ACTSPI_00380 [Candidatus Heimdallarchaeaceae archaeon]